MPKAIYLVVSPGTIVLAAYTREDLAIIHRRATTGAEVVEVALFDTVSDSVKDDLASDSDFDGDTPVEEL